MIDDQRRRFDDSYLASQSAVMQSIERRVCGCDYGATSWTTRAQADQMSKLMGLESSMLLLDVGAGAGWPGLYFAKTTGCDIALTDLPFEGLRIASDRAAGDALSGACWVAVADGARLPFRDESFDAISHCDALCCLPAKQEVLSECRRLIRNNGRMAFTVISVAPGLGSDMHRRAVESGPEFIEADADYPTLLARSGWAVLERFDLGAAYGDTCREMLQSYNERADELVAVIGASSYAEKRSKLAAVQVAIAEGGQRRELFVAAPK